MLSSQKSETQWTVPSFFGMIKVRDAHCEALQISKTPISQSHISSALKPQDAYAQLDMHVDDVE